MFAVIVANVPHFYKGFSVDLTVFDPILPYYVQ